MSSHYEPLTPAVLAFNEDGIPRSPIFDDLYHAEYGAQSQAQHVFLGGCRILDRWRGRRCFTVCETGFGLGQNFLALWHAWRTDSGRPARLHIISFEAHPFTRQDLEKVLMQRLDGPQLQLARQMIQAWPPLLPGVHRLEFDDGRVTLTLAFGKIERMAKQVSARVDAFFLDGFSPRANPGMWTPALFGQLVRLANRGATLATWCSVGHVRRALRDAGFIVSKVAGIGGKRHITQAVLRDNLGQPLLDEPRDRVMVIGGGLAGAGVAQSLALRGAQVVVLDPVFKHGLGASHQGHVAAALTPMINADDDIRARLSRAGLGRAMQRWQSLDMLARPRVCSTIEVCTDAQRAHERRQALAFLGFPSDWVRWVSANEATQLAGIRVNHGGVHFAQGQLVRPDLLIHTLLTQAGVSTVAQRVHGLHTVDGAVWQATAENGDVLAEANIVVLAGGGLSLHRLPGLPLMPALPKITNMRMLAGQVNYFDAQPGTDTQVILSGEGYWLPSVQDITVGGSTYTPDVTAAVMTAQGENDIVAGLEKLSDQASGLRSRSTGWAGWRAALSDRLPVIGQVGQIPGLWMACAYGSRGLTWSALAGDIVSATLYGEPQPLERELIRKIVPR
jgi:tRNA 5-methylaminomethyl-2-thiouridine biosynthesis bifunctional protein